MRHKSHNIIIIVIIDSISTCPFISKSGQQHEKSSPSISQSQLSEDNCIYSISKEVSNCTDRLYKSFQCYQDGIKRYNIFHKEKQTAGCNLINFLADCCDKLLCNIPDRLESIKNYAIYVETVFDDFDLQKCQPDRNLSKSLN